MRNPWKIILAAAALSILPAMSAIAQEDEAALLGRTRENIITFKLLRMTQALALTQEQSAKIYPEVTRIEKEKYGLTQKLSRTLDNLKSLLAAEPPAEEKLLQAMADVEALRVQIKAKDEELAAFLKPNLSVVQNARLILFQVEFYRGLGERLARARMQRTQKKRFTR